MNNFFPPLTAIEQFRTDAYRLFLTANHKHAPTRLWAVLDEWQKRLDAMPSDQQEQTIDALLNLGIWSNCEIFEQLDRDEILEKIEGELEVQNAN